MLGSHDYPLQLPGHLKNWPRRLVPLSLLIYVARRSLQQRAFDAIEGESDGWCDALKLPPGLQPSAIMPHHNIRRSYGLGPHTRCHVLIYIPNMVDVCEWWIVNRTECTSLNREGITHHLQPHVQLVQAWYVCSPIEFARLSPRIRNT